MANINTNLNLYEDAYFLKSFYCMGAEHHDCYNCSYCRARGKRKLKEFFKVPSTINPLFINLPVSVNIFYGDPLLYQFDTKRVLKSLSDVKHKGPVIIITHSSFDDKNVRELFKEGEELNIHVGLSFFGNDKYDKRATLKNLETNLNEMFIYHDLYGYTYNIEYRPLINGINDDEATIESVFKLAKMYNTSIAYSGLQVEPELAEYIKENNLPFKPYEGFDFGMKKNVSKEVENRFRSLSIQYGVPVFKKTSCAITYAQELGHDYNAHYYRPNEVGCPTCPNKHRCHIFKTNNCTCDIIEQLPFNMKLVWKEHHSCRLHREGLCKFPSPDCLDINGWLLQTDRELTTSDVRVIKWLTGFTVDAKFTELPYIQKDWLCE